ncbi:hypothetical protein [Acetobacter senegalensis]|uniref:hypothetical protein n=1 Tax=Acetobacter senegalensis TaxID=446692 RepID=UPI00264F5B0A|nr:hypothetical protein [Acetobacter senegalensis]MDN7351050.1 hypothetical protein [Acetobacter senegalensis]
MHPVVSRLASLAAGSAAVCALALGGVVAGLPSEAHAQASVLLKHQSAKAVVETVDHDARELLLREANGHLITIEYGSAVRDLPHVNAGDKLSISFVETLGADLAPPGSPLPESTLTTARGYVHGHPRGVIASFRRERAKIDSIDLPTHTVSFSTEDGSSHVAVLRTQAMQDFLKTLKVGDVIDITRMESISYVILNEQTEAAQDAANAAAAAGAASAPAAPVPATAPQSATVPTAPVAPAQ